MLDADSRFSTRRGDSLNGLRMSADDFYSIPDDGYFYELIDGVVIVTPSPTPKHQDVWMEIVDQLRLFLRVHPIGKVFAETDVHFGKAPSGADVVYRPEAVVYRRERLPGMEERLVGAPEIVVEVISAGSRRMDTLTKMKDYERFGVQEYWLIDPENEAFTFYRCKSGRFEEIIPTECVFVSDVLPGFSLDLIRVRETFKPWF